jgi:hypothetical protein
MTSLPPPGTPILQRGLPASMNAGDNCDTRIGLGLPLETDNSAGCLSPVPVPQCQRPSAPCRYLEVDDSLFVQAEKMISIVFGPSSVVAVTLTPNISTTFAQMKTFALAANLH